MSRGTSVGLVGEVRVHLHDALGAELERPAEPGDVRGAEALLARSVEHRDPLVLGREAVGDVAGAIGGIVVDDEDPGALGRRREHRGNQRLEVVRFVVGGHDDPDR